MLQRVDPNILHFLRLFTSPIVLTMNDGKIIPNYPSSNRFHLVVSLIFPDKRARQDSIYQTGKQSSDAQGQPITPAHIG